MKKYLIKQHYPSLPNTWLPGTVLIQYKPVFGFVYYSDENNIGRVSKSEVEDNPHYFEKL